MWTSDQSMERGRRRGGVMVDGSPYHSIYIYMQTGSKMHGSCVFLYVSRFERSCRRPANLHVQTGWINLLNNARWCMLYNCRIQLPIYRTLECCMYISSPSKSCMPQHPHYYSEFVNKFPVSRLGLLGRGREGSLLRIRALNTKPSRRAGAPAFLLFLPKSCTGEAAPPTAAWECSSLLPSTPCVVAGLPPPAMPSPANCGRIECSTDWHLEDSEDP